MNQNSGPLFYAKAACDTMMRKFAAPDLPPKGRFHYHQGVFLSGMEHVYRICGEKKYIQYVKDWVDSLVNEKGEFLEMDHRQLDGMQAGILLYPLLDLTGDERYRKALDTIVPYIRDFPRNEAGGFWHKEWYPDQMWLDGLYMGGPIIAEYGARFNAPEYLETAVNQVLLMQKYTRDERTGLWYHAWDSSRKASWADPETGLSPEFWGRSIGWVPVAVLDELEFVPAEHPKYGALCDAVTNLLTALCRYQSEDGRWYQVVDKGGMEGNWLENSCSCLYTAAICRAVKKGLLPESYLENARRGYEGVIKSLTWDGEDLQLGYVCVGTGVGDYRHYCERPVSVNDLHGMGAFLLMCAACEESL